MRTRVAIIGLDGAEPTLVFDRWLSDLPVLSRLVGSGAWGPLRTIDPPISVPAWSCMATSRDPGDLGIYGFRNRTDHSYTSLVTADSRWVTADRVWDLLGRAGKHVIVLGVPQSYPPLPVNGEMISCFLTPDTRRNDFTYPTALKAEIESLLGGYYKADVEDFRADDRERILDQIYEMTEQRFALARHLLKTREWDFFMMHEIGLDRMHHAFWRFMDPTHRDHQPNHKFSTAIHDYYVYLDDELGELLELMDDATTVLVVSDHGGQRMDGAVRINDWLIREGYMVLQQPIEGNVPLSRANVDWSRTRAWGEGGYYSRLNVNVLGREPQGVVSRDEYEPLRDELAARLEALGGPDGEPIGTRVFRPEGLWRSQNGFPPDLVVYFGDLTWRSNGSVGSSSVYSFENDTGPDDANHTRHGVMVMAGPRVQPGQQQGLEIYDVAPTVLDLFGLPIAPGMRGRVVGLQSTGL